MVLAAAMMFGAMPMQVMADEPAEPEATTAAVQETEETTVPETEVVTSPSEEIAEVTTVTTQADSASEDAVVEEGDGKNEQETSAGEEIPVQTDAETNDADNESVMEEQEETEDESEPANAEEIAIAIKALEEKIDKLPSVREATALLSKLDDENIDEDTLKEAKALQEQILAMVADVEALSNEDKASVSNLNKFLSLYALFATVTINLDTVQNKGLGEALDGDYAYLSNVKISGRYTGTAPFDSEEGDGNDTTQNDDILRTFDTAQYNVSFETHVRDDAEHAMYKTGKLYFEFVVPGTSDEVQIEDSSMAWLRAKTDCHYTISEDTLNGETVQVLRGYYTLEPQNGNEQGVGETEQDLSFIFRALALKNGDTIEPQFTLWMEYNDIGVDYSAWGTDNYTNGVVSGNTSNCAEHGDGEAVTVVADPVKISAIARYNLRLVNCYDGTGTTVGNFDFSTGDDDAINNAVGTKNGRMNCYGLALVIVGKSESEGLRGVELPQGSIDASFELSFDTKFTLETATAEYPSRVISIPENSDFSLLVWGGRSNSAGPVLPNGRMITTPYSYNSTLPYSDGTGYNHCYKSGDWTFEQNGNTVKVTVTGAVFNSNYLPNTTAHGGRNYATYYDPSKVENYWDIQYAYFSTGALWVLQPYYDSKGTYICNLDGSGNGSFNTVIKDSNLNIEISDGTSLEPVDQVITDDDQVQKGVALLNPGTIVTFSRYVKTGHTDIASSESALTSGGAQTGEDWITPGGKLSVGGAIQQDQAERGYRAAAFDILIKFDDAFFDPDENSMRGQVLSGTGSYLNDQLLWGGKIGGWNHKGLSPDEDGYDEEMLKATADDLVFFESLSELEAAGYTCVAALSEVRAVAPEGTIRANVVAQGTAKTTAETNQVYMIVQSGTAWSLDNLSAVSGKTVDEILSMSTEEQNALIKEYIPSKTAGLSYAEYPTASLPEFHPTSYQKPYYDENGYNSRTEGTVWGDSCLLVGLTTSTSISPAQNYTSGSSAGTTKYSYDMDTSQRIADFVVQPTITRPTSDAEEDGQAYYTDVTVTVTLPNGVTYLPGSSYVGGEYTQNGEGVLGTVDTSSIPGANPSEDGSVASYTASTGNTVDTTMSVGTVVVKENGVDVTKTQLTYVMKNVYYNSGSYDIDPIHFSTVIGTAGNEDTDVKDGASLSFVTDVECTEDNQRAKSIANGNEATTSIEISKRSVASLSKFADQTVVEADDDMGFTMNLGNTANTSKSIIAVDGLPYNGDGASRFTGDLVVTDLRVTNISDLSASSITYYYTTDTNVRGKTSKDLTESEITSGWTELTINSDGTFTLPNNFKPVAIAAVGTLAPQTNLRMHLKLNLPDGKGGEFVQNRWTNDNLSAFAYSYIVQRTIDGLVWIDADKDGVQDEDETIVSNATVTLKKLNDSDEYETVATIQTGQQYDRLASTQVSTYTEGQYRFSNLLPGTYRVEFTSGDGIYLPIYTATDVNVGSDTTIDSDGIAVTEDNGQLSSTYADVAEFVPASEMTYATESRHNIDSGFYLTETEVTVTKNWAGDEAYKDTTRPDSITVQLYADDKAVKDATLELTAENNWTDTFENLQMYHDADPYDAIEYTVKEVAVDGYTPSYSDGEDDSLIVTNTLNKSESGTVSFQVQKLREGDDSVVVPGAVFTLSDGTTATTDEKGIATFTYNFTDESETVKLTMTETYAPAGYTKSNQTWNVTLTRGEEPEITLKQNIFQIIWSWFAGVESDDYEDGILTVTNAYNAEADFTLTGSKTLTGRTMVDDEFSFTVKEGDEVVATGLSKSDNTIAFTPIHYTYEDEGVHTYTITEDSGNLGGVSYADSSFEVKVTVTDNKNGTLTVTPEYPSDGVAFENIYKATGKIILTAEKKLNGRKLNAGEFNFTVSENGKMVVTGTNDADGNIVFSEISYDLEDVGIHTYTVTEDEGTLGGVTYSEESYEVIVDVTDNGDGTLAVVASYPETGVIFNNVYEAAGSVTLEAQKTLNGRDLNDGEFHFIVSEDDESVATGTNDEEGNITFTDISYTLDDVGTHAYTVFEQSGVLGGVAYDETSFEVTVNVSDNGDGSLSVETIYPEDGVTFVNEYTASGDAVIRATKTLTGRELAAEEFSFTLTEGEDLIQTVQNAEDGIITFDGLHYTLDDVGEHSYTIAEEKGNLGGVTYDDATYDVLVNVTDNGDGTLNTEVTYLEDGGIVFENTYDTETAALQLTGTKELTGRKLADGEFTFSVREGDKVVATGTNGADGKIKFSEIAYGLKDVGTHTLIITEDAGDKGGVDYSKESYTLNVNVSDNGDGTLNIAVTEPENGIVFHNNYESAEAIVTLGAKKNYTGAVLKDGQFSFELKDADGKVVETVKNAADGSISFTALRFTEVGTYIYTISEVDDKQTSVTYDTTVYTVKIDVTDDGEGKLVAAVDTGDKDLVFNNKFTTPLTPTPTTTPSNGSRTSRGNGSSSSATRASSAPRTGDYSNVALWALMLAISGAALTAALMRRRKNNK